MAQIQRVIILNKPFKIRGYTLLQWVIIGVSFAVAIIFATKVVDPSWKVGGLPVSLWVFVALFGMGLGYVHVIQSKPLNWWINRITYPLGLAPSVYLPKREEGQEYPDSSIKEPVKREDQSYVAVEHFEDEPFNR
jgi:hypothetical protein